MKEFDWSKPQRQPIAGLGIVFLNTLWEIIKRFWPVALVFILGRSNKVDRFEIFMLAFLVITIVTSLFRFLYFRFYLEGNKLIIKKGWLNKETQVIPLEKIQTVNIEQGPLHQMLNIVKLTIDTAGSQKAEATIGALHQSMAHALRQQLLAHSSDQINSNEQRPVLKPLIRLEASDLLKLSISANHLEAFFLLLSFGFGLYENLNNIDSTLLPGLDEFMPDQALWSILILIITVLIITIIVSTIRIFFRFYHFRMLRNDKGYHVRSGLTNIKERLVGLNKIQFISWKANWIRRLMRLWIFEYHMAGGDQVKETQKVQIPITRDDFIPILANDYQAIGDTSDAVNVRMHSSFVVRRLLILGLIPAALLSLALWWSFGWNVLYSLFLPVIVLIIAWCQYRKFRLWAMDDAIKIRKGIFGEEFILMQWHKLQAVTISQSIFQRRKGLANVFLHTAGGSIKIPFINLEAARQISDYALHRVEASKKDWM